MKLNQQIGLGRLAFYKCNVFFFLRWNPDSCSNIVRCTFDLFVRFRFVCACVVWLTARFHYQFLVVCALWWSFKLAALDNVLDICGCKNKCGSAKKCQQKCARRNEIQLFRQRNAIIVDCAVQVHSLRINQPNITFFNKIGSSIVRIDTVLLVHFR